ncbi:MAG: hypothetical protein ACOCX2_15650, partial [Armatimonadota bacterium]
YAGYEFLADQAGEYWLWARVRTGEGHWRFRDVVNGTVWWFFDEGGRDEAPENPDQWHWMFRREVTLREGYNRLQVTDYGYDFPQIDRFVFALTEDWTPEGDGPKAVTRQNETGWVETAPIEIPGLQRIDRIDFLPPGCTRLQWRFGEGEWAAREVPLDEDGFPETLPLDSLAGDGPLQVRLTLSPPSGFDNVLQPPPLLTAQVSDRLVEMGDEHTRLLLDRETAGLLMVGEFEATANPGTPHPLFSIDFKLPGERRKVRVDPVSVTEIIAEHDETRGPADVVAVDFPRLRDVTIGASGLDDTQFRMQSFGHEVVNPGSGPLRDAAYCGQVVMPWQSVYDRQGGLYVGAHDPQAYNVEFVSEAGGLAAETFSFAPRKLDDIKPGEERTYPYVVAVHGGGWHAGADIYREWFNETFGRAEYPEFMRTMDGWINLQAENMRETFRFAQLPDYLTRARAIGLDWTQVWGQFAYDGGPCCHDLPVLSPMYGGHEGWEAACREIVSRGGYVGGYFIYDRIDQVPIATDWMLGHFNRSEYPEDTPWPTSELMNELMAVTDPGGELPQWPPTEETVAGWQEQIDEHQATYAAGERARAVTDWRKIWCDDEDWRAYLREWIAERYAGQWSANACYIDVLGCGSTMESHDPRRGHNGAGTWGPGKLAIAREVTEAAREVFPDYAPSMEGMGDLPGLYMASMCSGVYRGGRNVMRYTFPDRLFIHGLANSRSGGEHIDRYAETFLEGMRYDFVGMPGADGIRWLRLHRSFTPWLYQARFMDTVGVQVSDPRVKFRRFDLPDGAPDGVLLTVVNRERLPRVDVALDPEIAEGISRGFFVTIDGEVG